VPSSPSPPLDPLLWMLLALTLWMSCSRSPAPKAPTLPPVTPLCEPVTLPAPEVEAIDCMALVGPPPSLTTLRGLPRCSDPSASCWTRVHADLVSRVIVQQAEWIATMRRCIAAGESQ
jgi:hypothetical protein